MDRYVPISDSVSLNLIPDVIFLCNVGPHLLVSLFITALSRMATQSKAQMKPNSIQVERAIRRKLCIIREQLSQRRNRKESECLRGWMSCCIRGETGFVYPVFWQMQNHLIDLQEQIERYCNVLPVFGFNCAKYDINSIKSFLLLNLVNNRDIEPTVIKKANQVVSLISIQINPFYYWIL